MSFWVISNSIAAWLLPPGFLLILAAWGLVRLRKHPRSGKALVGLALVTLWVLATPWASRLLLRTLETAPLDVAAAPAQAIVVLGGGKYYNAPEYGGNDTVSEATLVRLRYAAHLYRQTGKPILVSGGEPVGSAISEALAMKTVLENDFKTPVTWMEARSNNTLENARASRAILAPLGIQRVYVLTHAWHMPRSQRVFTEAGFEVVPAASAYATYFELTIRDFMPQAKALDDSSHYFHEIIGMLWYRLKSLRH